MTKDEALKMALEFIENSECGTADLEAHIKEALAQEQEPDVQETLHWHAFNYRQAHTAQAHEMWLALEQFVESKTKQPAQQEPVAYLCENAAGHRQTARIVDLQTHIENFDGEDR